jgi:predicted lactoylglutathione lyase
MTSITSLTLEGADPSFYASAFGLNGQISTRAADAPSSGFRGFTVSLVVTGPANVDSFVGSALKAGATELKPVKRSFWGYGGVVEAPDGSIWKIATSSKKDEGAADRRVDDIVLLLGVADVATSKRFYVEHGLTVKRGFGSKYVEFAGADGTLKLALYGRKALAKDAGVPVDGNGSHRLVIGGDAGAFTDPDGFTWSD